MVCIIPIIDPSGNSIAISKASICTAVHFGYRPSLAVSSSTGILHAISPPNQQTYSGKLISNTKKLPTGYLFLKTC